MDAQMFTHASGNQRLSSLIPLSKKSLKKVIFSLDALARKLPVSASSGEIYMQGDNIALQLFLWLATN